MGQVMRGASSLCRLAAGLAAALMVGCANRPVSLYMWETFPRQQYDTLLRNGMSPSEQIQMLQAHAEKARAANAALPPGFRAHLGMLQLDAGNVEQARSLWQAEKANFPESTPYMDKLLERLDGPSAKKPGSPA